MCGHILKRERDFFGAYVCVNQCGQMRPKQSHTVKGVNGESAVRGIDMEIKITWRSDSISVHSAVAEGPLTIQIHEVKLVQWRSEKGQHKPHVYAFSYWLKERSLHQGWHAWLANGACETMQINVQISNSVETSLCGAKSKSSNNATPKKGNK